MSTGCQVPGVHVVGEGRTWQVAVPGTSRDLSNRWADTLWLLRTSGVGGDGTGSADAARVRDADGRSGFHQLRRERHARVR